MTCRLLMASLFSLGLTGAALAETVLAARTIPARSVIAQEDLRLVARETPGGSVSLAEAIGLEARVTIYGGRPVRAADLVPPALIERNEVVRLRFVSGALVIEADGRALGRGAVGDRINVMNLASRTTVSGQIASDGSVEVTR